MRNMGTDSPAYAEANKKWSATCRMIFGRDVGEVSDYAEWLSEIRRKNVEGISSVSKKAVFFSVPHYSKDARKIALDEVDFEKRFPPLSINEIKDIDSIICAVSDRIAYAGDVVLGNSNFVEKGSNIVDSNYIYDCDQIGYSKHVAYCNECSYSERMFGCQGFGYASFSILCAAYYKSTRCLWAHRTDGSSDCYYVHGLCACKDCMFCFNLRGKRFAIGNLVLPKGKYMEIKGKLVSEMADELERKKRLPHLFDIASASKPDLREIRRMASELAPHETQKIDKCAVEKAFSDTAGIVLGKRFSGIDRYADWLRKYTRRTELAVSCASGKPLVVSDYNIFMQIPSDRLLGIDEADSLCGKICMSEKDAPGISLRGAAGIIPKIAYFSADWPVGKVVNAIESPIAIDSSHCYKNILAV